MAACRLHTKRWNTLLLLFIVVLVNKGVSLDVRGKPVVQSTTASPPDKVDGTVGNAVDGNLFTSSHSDYPEAFNNADAWVPYQNPWWRLDLQAVYCIRKITIINRITEFPKGADRILGAEVQVGLKPYYDQTEVKWTVSPDQVTSFTRVIQFIAEPPITARYVGIYLNGTSFKILHMAEVMVEEIIDEQTIAAKAISVNQDGTTQSSTVTDGSDIRNAYKAVNRAFKYVFPDCSETNNERNPWWRMELMSTQCVRKILVKGRDADHVQSRVPRATENTGERERFQGATVRAGLSTDLTENTVCGQPVTEYQAVANNWIEFDCNPPYGVTARYISVNIDRTTSLSLCEVIPLPCDLPEDDFTFVASPALLGSTGDDNAALTAYKGPTDIGAGVSFGRQLATGGGYELPQGSVEENDSFFGCAARRLLLPALGGIDRTGVFYFDAWQDNKKGRGTVATRIQAIKLPKDDTTVHIRPAQRTQTANIGDLVTLEMRDVNSPNTNYRWKHDEAAMPLWDDQLSVSIDDATTSDAGVYSCFAEGIENEQLHGITRLIVRGCRAGLWGPPSCSFTCRRCYNGGVCNENSGTCICAPGFSGIYCEKVHGRNVFGQGASFRCSEDTTDPQDSACRGRLFCLPDPYGCSCAAGYMGLDCMQECPVGMYGADCKQNCHCASGVMCSKDTGECLTGACDSQYFGINCQCTRQEASPGRVTASSVEKREVTFYWVEPSCPISVGVIIDYQYKLTVVESGLISSQSDIVVTSVEITGLVPYTEYSFQVAAKTAQGVGPFSEGIIVMTSEAKPTKPLNVTVESGDETSLTIVWAKPNPPQGVITSYVIRHKRIGTEYTPFNIPNVGTTPLRYKIPDLTLNATYSIQVRAWTSVGVGPWSDAIIDTVVGVPGPIRNLRVTNKDERSVTFNWEAPLDPRGPLPRYLVEYRALEKRHISNFTPENDYVTIDVNSPPYTQDNLDPGSKYEFRVAATNQRFTGNYSVAMEYTEVLKNPPKPNSPKTLPDKTTATTVTVDLSSLLTGTDVTFATSFVIDVKKLTPMSKREALEPRRYEDSPDNYITADIPKGNVTETFTVGDGQMYGGYYNAPLQTNGEYAVKVGSVTRGNGTEQYVTYSDEINFKVTLPSSGRNTGIIVGIVILVIVLIAIVLAIIVYKRRTSATPAGGSNQLVKRPSDNSLDKRYQDGAEGQTHNGDSNVPLESIELRGNGAMSTEQASTTTTLSEEIKVEPFTPPPPVRIGELANYIKTKDAAGELGFKADYKTLPDGQMHPWTVARKSQNKQKNRFGNVIAYDHSRVVLEPLEHDPHSDYINACYIDGYKEKDKYIASQGPNKGSLQDIWRMVWQLGVDKIVMLTNPVENGKMKCLQYWPDTGTTAYSDISVTIIDEQHFLDHSVRLFKITKTTGDENYRMVKHYHYTTWPDMKPPEYPTPLLNFKRVVDDEQNTGRTLTHCSAGVGRTGTFIALDAMLEQLKAEGQIDVLGFIYRMRQKRIMMVQTAEQYKFLFDAVLASYLSGVTTYDIQDLHTRLMALKKTEHGSTETGLEKQFKTLVKLRVRRGNESSKSGQLPENADKNRYPDFIPSDRVRPFLMTNAYADDTNYINANFLPGYYKKQRYIATQMPMPNTVADIWRMVYDNKATCIVMLNPLDASDVTMERYWPEDGPIAFGSLVVEPMQTTQYKGILSRTFKLGNEKDPSEPPRTICQFQYQDWNSDQEIPNSWKGMLTLMDLTLKWHKEKNPIVVHCLDGLGRSAVYCTLMSVLEQCTEEKVVDIFQAVLRLRIVNRDMMYSLDHYRMCYEVIQYHIDSATTIYENQQVTEDDSETIYANV